MKLPSERSVRSRAAIPTSSSSFAKKSSTCSFSRPQLARIIRNPSKQHPQADATSLLEVGQATDRQRELLRVIASTRPETRVTVQSCRAIRRLLDKPFKSAMPTRFSSRSARPTIYRRDTAIHLRSAFAGKVHSPASRVAAARVAYRRRAEAGRGRCASRRRTCTGRPRGRAGRSGAAWAAL